MRPPPGLGGVLDRDPTVNTDALFLHKRSKGAGAWKGGGTASPLGLCGTRFVLLPLFLSLVLSLS